MRHSQTISLTRINKMKLLILLLEAVADPLLYYGYGTPYSYAHVSRGYGYPYTYGYPYSYGYPYYGGYHLPVVKTATKEKRSADADPDADAYYYYGRGYYGGHHGYYGHGYRSYYGGYPYYRSGYHGYYHG